MNAADFCVDPDTAGNVVDEIDQPEKAAGGEDYREDDGKPEILVSSTPKRTSME